MRSYSFLWVDIFYPSLFLVEKFSSSTTKENFFMENPQIKKTFHLMPQLIFQLFTKINYFYFSFSCCYQTHPKYNKFVHSSYTCMLSLKEVIFHYQPFHKGALNLDFAFVCFIIYIFLHNYSVSPFPSTKPTKTVKNDYSPLIIAHSFWLYLTCFLYFLSLSQEPNVLKLHSKAPVFFSMDSMHFFCSIQETGDMTF